MSQVCAGCKARIVWARMDSGKLSPFDADPSPKGDWTLEQAGGEWRARHSPPPAEPDGVERYLNHFATCPVANDFRSGAA